MSAERWEVNDAHEDYRALRGAGRTRVRYLLALRIAPRRRACLAPAVMASRKSAVVIEFPSPDRAYVVILEDLRRELWVLIDAMQSMSADFRRKAAEDRQRRLDRMKARTALVDSRFDCVELDRAPANDVRP
jgi:hypothetical protein